jgi:beta-lactamase class A
LECGWGGFVKASDFTLRVAIPVLCMVGGGAGGFWVRGRIAREEGGRAITELREDGYRFISPLLECDTERDLIRNRELLPFKEKVEAYLRDRMRFEGVGTVSLYFRELNDGPWFSVNDDARFSPASMRKVPMMIALLKESERMPDLLSRKVTAQLKQDHNAYQNIKPSQALEPGKAYEVGDLISRMIAYSYNNAFMLLSGMVDQNELGKVYELLSIPNPSVSREDHKLSVYTYASFFRILYNATYLSRERSEQALELLAGSEFRSGIVSGVPKEILVAHKFGEHSDPATGEKQLHDCGIVYHRRHPYLLCVMTRGSSLEYLDDAIAALSKVVYAEVDAQHGRHPLPN